MGIQPLHLQHIRTLSEMGKKSLGLTLPVQITKKLGLEKGKQVSVRLAGEKIII